MKGHVGGGPGFDVFKASTLGKSQADLTSPFHVSIRNWNMNACPASVGHVFVFVQTGSLKCLF